MPKLEITVFVCILVQVIIDFMAIDLFRSMVSHIDQLEKKVEALEKKGKTP